ncbi:hypothetical protein CsSME_00050135 [Camellia sinensis var. sinensis]
MSLLRRVNTSLPQVVGFTRRSLKSLKFAGDSLDSSSSPALIHGIHVFHCPDTLGIVAKLSECIASRGGNILGADIFVPQKKQVFYSRSDFVFDPAKWPRVKMEEDFLKLSKMFNAMKSVVRVPTVDPKYKIAVLASKQAFDAGVKLIGATSHFVTEELDAGPIIEQMVERVSHRDNLQSFIQKSENLEKQCLAMAIKSYCELRVLPYEENKTVVF